MYAFKLSWTVAGSGDMHQSHLCLCHFNYQQTCRFYVLQTCVVYVVRLLGLPCHKATVDDGYLLWRLPHCRPPRAYLTLHGCRFTLFYLLGAALMLRI